MFYFLFALVGSVHWDAQNNNTIKSIKYLKLKRCYQNEKLISLLHMMLEKCQNEIVWYDFGIRNDVNIRYAFKYKKTTC